MCDMYDDTLVFVGCPPLRKKNGVRIARKKGGQTAAVFRCIARWLGPCSDNNRKIYMGNDIDARTCRVNRYLASQVIDFEYSGYNHRGFDIANHFCEVRYVCRAATLLRAENSFISHVAL